MYYYYIFTLITSMSFFLNKTAAYYLTLLAVPIFLYLLPSTGYDYEFYKLSYDSAQLVSNFPYFVSHTILTAEPLYVWYTSLVSVITPFSFPLFLSLNFIINIFLYNIALKRFDQNIIKYFLLYLLPVILPTLFYFSPRSSISFSFVLLGFFTLCYSRKFYGVLFLLLGLSFHSQFSLICSYILILYIISKKISKYTQKKTIYLNLILALTLFVFLIFIDSFINIISHLFSFLPSATVAISKLHYIQEDTTPSGFRLTSLLSILIYPVILLYLIKTSHKTKLSNPFLFCIVGVVFFGVAINLAFITQPHVAGRLSRFSDFFCMAFLIPYTLYINKHYLSIKVIAIIMCLIAPLLFRSLYINANGII